MSIRFIVNHSVTLSLPIGLVNPCMICRPEYPRFGWSRSGKRYMTLRVIYSGIYLTEYMSTAGRQAWKF